MTPERRAVDSAIELSIKTIQDDIKLIKLGIYGNGSLGMKARVTILETRFWIIIILLAPLTVWSVKALLMGCK